MTIQMGWLAEPHEWNGIPQEDRGPRKGPRGLVMERLERIVKTGKAGKPFLLECEPLEQRRALSKRASDYRRRYAKAGFRFEVRRMPGEDAVGLWTLWRPDAGRGQSTVQAG